MRTAPVKGTVVLPSEDTNTPQVPIGASMLEIAVNRALTEAAKSGRVLIMPSDFQIPTRFDTPFVPKEIAAHMDVSDDNVVALLESGEMIGFPTHAGRRTTWRVPWFGLAYYFLRQQGALN